MDDRHPWMAFFSAATLKQGREYAFGGAVGKIERVGERMTAKVTGGTSYKVRIELAEQATVPRLGLVAESLSSACTCPVEVLCKHAAATLFAWCMQAGISLPDPDSPEIDRARLALDGDIWDDDDEVVSPPTARFTTKPPEIKKEDAPEPPQLAVAQPWQGPQAIDADRWLEQLRRLNRPSGDQRLTYHLLHEHGAWFINLVASRRLKNGTLGILKRFDDPDKVLRDRPPYLTSADAALVARIAALTDQGDRWRTSPALSRENGASGDLLAAILATGKVFLGSFLRPIATGPALPVTPVWVQQDGGWRLRLRDAQGLDPDIIPVDPPWYVAQGVAGPLASELPADVQAAILRMPLLPPALVAAAAGDLAAAAPELPPSPINLLVDPPIPELVRWTVKLDREPRTWPTTRNPVTLAVVHFRYGETLVTPQGPRLVKSPDGGPLARDFRAEAIRIEELTTLGLVPFNDQRQFLGAARWPRSGLVLLHKGQVAAATAPELPVVIPDGVIAALAAAGWVVSGGGDLPAPPLSATTVEAHFTEEEGRDWFALHLGITVAGEQLDITPMLVRLLDQGEAGLNGLPRFTAEDREWVCLGLPDGRVVRLPVDLLRRLVAHLLELYAAPGGQGWKVEAWQAAALTGIDGMQAESGPRMAALADRLKALGTPMECEPPDSCTAVLRPYQKLGLGWLRAIHAAEVGGILADDMGLGKTVQTIAFLATLHPASTRPSLVVCPASMVGTWKRELARFAPGLTSEILHGNERLKDAAALAKRNILITTYGTCLRDRELLASIPLEALICDEAQALKNAAAKTGEAIRSLDARTRIALTGTPMENHLGELHALLGWLVPGLLGTAARFDQAFRKPIERDGDNARADLLRRRIAPFMLRRTKTAVAPELPPRTEQVVTVELEGAQRALYESVRLAMDDRIRAVLAAKGLGKGHIEILDALLKLRQCCCDPRLVKLPGTKQSVEAGSAKLAWLNETLPELVEEGRRVLVFSQFTSYLDLIESDVLRPSGIPFLRLDGSTTNRDVLVQGFQAGDAPVFLLSLKAGGTGLTLTAADTVIFCDPWWNPAAEAQAADRAHRIGQDKPVFIWRLVASGTVEERILVMQERKRALLDNILDADGQAVPAFDEADLAALMAPLP
jgi:superfamily II DNA or RNA helicase